MRRTGLVLGLILVLTLTLYQCNSPEEKPEVSDLIWLNHHDTVSYVGMDACSGCHGDVRHTFVHTGMGKSFDHATPGKAFFDWDGSEVIVDPHSGYSYQPYFVDSTLFVLGLEQKVGTPSTKEDSGSTISSEVVSTPIVTFGIQMVSFIRLLLPTTHKREELICRQDLKTAITRDLLESSDFNA